MIRKFKITYRAVIKCRSIVIDAFSKYDAKWRFYCTYPKYEILSVEEVENESKNT